MDDKQKIKLLKQYFEELERLGVQLQETSNFYLKVSDEGKVIAGGLETHADNLLPEEKRVLEVLFLQITSNPLPESTSLPNIKYLAVSTGTGTGHVFQTYPNETLEHIMVSGADPSGARPIGVNFLATLQNELDDKLKIYRQRFNIHVDLVQKRKGAWDSFYSLSSDNLTQAANSMRLILTTVISQSATNEDIISAGLYVPKEGKKIEIGRELRISYLLFGKGPVDQSVLKFVAETVEQCDKDYSRLLKIAHGSKSVPDEVKKLLIKTEALMLGILRAVLSV